LKRKRLNWRSWTKNTLMQRLFTARTVCPFAPHQKIILHIPHEHDDPQHAGSFDLNRSAPSTIPWICGCTLNYLLSKSGTGDQASKFQEILREIEDNLTLIEYKDEISKLKDEKSAKQDKMQELPSAEDLQKLRQTTEKERTEKNNEVQRLEGLKSSLDQQVFFLSTRIHTLSSNVSFLLTLTCVCTVFRIRTPCPPPELRHILSVVEEATWRFSRGVL